MDPADPLKHLDIVLKKELKSVAPSAPAPKPVKPNPVPASPEEVRSGRTCYRKTPYLTVQEAKNRLRIKETENPGLKLYYYKCAICHKWHLTRSKP